MRRGAKGRHLKKPRPPILPFLVGLLLVITVISSTVSSGIMAKYSTASTDSDRARVAEFVTFRIEESQKDFWDIKPGDSFPYQANLTIEKAGETAYQMYFDLSVPTYMKDGSVTDLFTFPIAEGWTQVGDAESNGTRTYTYIYKGISPIGNIVMIEGNVTVAAYSPTMPDNAAFQITARAEQIG